MPEGYVFGPVMHLIQKIGERPTAAFPSSHVSVCLILLWLVIKYIKRLILLVSVITIVLILSTVYLRAHYLVDVIAGVLVAPLLYLFSVRLHKVLNEGVIFHFYPKSVINGDTDKAGNQS
jgi:membrane-associated phospholipid phosphatase